MTTRSSGSGSPLSFILRERLLSITVICSIITFQFISTFKINLFDPLLDFLIPEDKIDFLNVTIRDGVELPKYEPKKLVLDLGQIFKETLKYIFVIFIFYLLASYTRMQDEPNGNPGSAIL
jgi:hypothetical protein